MSDALRALLAAEAERAGFDALGVAAIPREWAAARRLDDFLAAGRHGDMDWLETTAERRRHPQAMWADALSAVMLGVSYAPDYDPLAVLAEPTRAAVSCYAKGKDYHDILKPRLKQVARAFAAASGAQVKVFVDTAPLMEKPLAALAGLGWQGRHTNLVARRGGSWLFLGAILTDAVIAADAPAEDACGSCRACLDICPTRAFPAPYQLDARRCIS
ncbi:MAG: tRNA epoxyqueuosine(34) reductase QueG, partial [Hyphomicrobiaceae bacterium]|nr:tRNA epoxyqueuosine(34) reductase QueG [Hyphomicrobiaceae bacterium]